MATTNDAPLREHLVRLLGWQDAHVSFEAAVAGLDHDAVNRRPDGFPHSPWQLLEHLRRTQRDILEFCTKSDYRELQWPADYWPAPDTTASAADWQASVDAFRADLEALQTLAQEADLFARIPHGSGQTYLRELLLVADHNAYHVGQLVAVRRLLGAWRSG